MVKRFGILISLSIVLIITMALSTGCGGKKLTTLKSGTLTIGIESYEPPFEYIENKHLVGFDVDLAKALAKELGLKVEFVNTPFKNLIDDLKAQKFDIIMSGMIITPERSEQVSFTTPYVDSNQSICVAKDSPIKDEAGLAGKIVGVQTGTVGVSTTKKINGIGEIRQYPDVKDALNDVENGRIDAVIHDYAINLFFSKQSGKTKVVKEIVSGDKCGIGVNKNNPDLLKALNDNLADFKSSTAYNTAYDKWFSMD